MCGVDLREHALGRDQTIWDHQHLATATFTGRRSPGFSHATASRLQSTTGKAHLPMSLLYLLGGRQRKSLFKNEEEQRLYEAALILLLDTSTGIAKVEIEYKTPPEACSSNESSHTFKSASLVGNKLYTCTSTEVLIFEVPSFKRIGYVSLPCFNDLHHVAPTPEGNLLAANTGLDMVVMFTPGGRVLAEWNVLGEDPWSRFSRDLDYRKIESISCTIIISNVIQAKIGQ